MKINEENESILREANKGKKFGTCSCSDCIKSTTVGAHMQKVNSSDKSWYIVPLCISCNIKLKSMTFEVRKYDLVAVNFLSI